MTRINFKLKYLFSLILLFQVYQINTYLIGVDLGSEFFKATMLKPNRPFTMVENLQSKTKTPTAISFKDDERGFGADAVVKKPRFPKQVLTFFHEYLGKKYNSDEVNQFIKEFMVSYDTEEDKERGTISIKINFNKEAFNFSIEEIFGMLFRYIKFLADRFSQTDIKDCVVTVPNFFGYKERYALAQAVELSKLNLVSMVSENVAAAVQFQMKKTFNDLEHYIFYNMGASYTQATLVSIQTQFETKNNKTQEVANVIKVLGESWDKHLGGQILNYNLIKLLMKKFDSLPIRKGKPSVIDNPIVAERILPHAERYKEILSANKEAHLSILGVDSGMNLEGKLTREEFEEGSLKDLVKSYIPVEKLLNNTGLSIGNITQIELIGGSIRVPKVQDVLKSKMGEYSNLIGTHMNGDDSMAFGAAFICANSSSNFKGSKKVELHHGTNYELRIKLKNLHVNNPEAPLPVCPDLSQNNTNSTNPVVSDEPCFRKLDKNTTLYKIRHGGSELSRTVSFRYDNDIIAEVFERFENENVEKLLMTYKIQGMQEVVSNMKKDNIPGLPKLNLKFKLDSRGILSLKADSAYEVHLYMSMQTGPTGGVEFVYTPNITEPFSAEELAQVDEELKNPSKNMTDGEKMVLKMKKDVGKKRTQEMKKDLVVETEYTIPKPMTAENIAEAKKKLDYLDEIDRDRIKMHERRNSLETLIYAKKEWIESKNSKVYGKDDEIDSAVEKLKEIDVWYEDEGFQANFTDLDTKISDLRDKFKVFETREKVHKQRELGIDKFHSEMNKTMDESTRMVKNKPWMETHFNTTFMKEIQAVMDWYKEIKEKQDALSLNDV
jgi:hypoxia up-regulated 1